MNMGYWQKSCSFCACPIKNYKIFLEVIERVKIKRCFINDLSYEAEIERCNPNLIEYSHIEKDMIKQSVQEILMSFSLINKSKNYITDSFLEKLLNSKDFSLILDSHSQRLACYL